MNQAEKAELFRSLHRRGSILVLPNAWDAASAKIIEEAGFPAVATTSAGVANSLGYPDGQRIPRDEMIAAIRRIASAVQVPVTADVEAGYGETPEAAAETARAAIAAGAVGINLEDSWEHGGRVVLTEIPLQQERIRAVRAAATAAGVPLVVNARTDVFVRKFGDEQNRLAEAVRRLNAYLQAGADCAFPILAEDPQLIAALVREVEGPVNILVRAGVPGVPELQKLGVARASFGSGLMRAAMATVRQIANELRGSLGADYHRMHAK